MFRHVSTEILPKNLSNLFFIVHLCIKRSILAIILFKYKYLGPSARGWGRWSRRGEKSPERAVAPPPPPHPPLPGPVLNKKNTSINLTRYLNLYMGILEILDMKLLWKNFAFNLLRELVDI